MSAVLPSIAHFLHVLNHHITPALMAKGFKPNVINAREGLARLTEKYLTDPIDVPRIQDDVIPATDGGYAVPVRIYHPQPDTALPVLVYFHGGGGMCGSVSVYDGIHRRLAVHTQHIVVAAEYRLAPENPYPAGEQDALTTVRGVRTVLAQNHMAFNGHVAMGGDSAGGALATAVAQQAQHDASLGVDALVLIYPSVDFCMNSPSIDSLAEGYLLTAQRMRWYFAHYFQHGEDYCAASTLHGHIGAHHPPTLILTAGFDPLRDEGRAYADKLEAAGVAVQYHNFERLIHAFLNLENLCQDECRAAYRIMAHFLQTYTAESPT